MSGKRASVELSGLCGAAACALLLAGCAAPAGAPEVGAASAPGVAARPAETKPPAPAPAARSAPPAKAGAQAAPSAPIATPAAKPPSAAPALAKPPAAPALDLASLEKRLRETDAIGVVTKIALKNQIDDLLEQFRAFYQGRQRTTLAALRQPYERLLMKVLALLQDGDPQLASAVSASREAIWGILSDPAKFAAI